MSPCYFSFKPDFIYVDEKQSYNWEVSFVALEAVQINGQEGRRAQRGTIPRLVRTNYKRKSRIW
jgi:hypothetical protein